MVRSCHRAGAACWKDPMKIHFVTDAELTCYCVRYRCHHLQEQLATQGIETALSRPQDGPHLSVEGDVTVLYRMAYNESVQQIIDGARARGQGLVFATDDLLFTSDLARKLFLDRDLGLDTTLGA